MEYEAIDPKDIRSEKQGLTMLIIRQLDRFNYMACVVRSNRVETNSANFEAICFGMKNTLFSIENMLSHVIDGEYEKKVEEVKNKLKQIEVEQGLNRNNAQDYIELVFDWHKLLMSLLGEIGLVPAKEIEYYFEE